MGLKAAFFLEVAAICLHGLLNCESKTGIQV